MILGVKFIDLGINCKKKKEKKRERWDAMDSDIDSDFLVHVEFWIASGGAEIQMERWAKSWLCYKQLDA